MSGNVDLIASARTIQGLTTFYEKRQRWVDYARGLQELMQLFIELFVHISFSPLLTITCEDADRVYVAHVGKTRRNMQKHSRSLLTYGGNMERRKR